MKKSLLFLCIFLGSGFFLNIFCQQSIDATPSQKKTRTVYIFVVDLDSQTEVNSINNHLITFDGKVETIECNLQNQMCTLEVQVIKDIDLIEIFASLNFTAFIKTQLPPEGQKFVYNPDGTWKIKEI
jgi:hypothetical protein